jgi:hypothetical protein
LVRVRYDAAAATGGRVGDPFREDLQRQIASGQCIAIIGAGVATHTTDGATCASWQGLLRDGVSRCEAVASHLPAGWSERVYGEIDSGDLDELLSAAEKVARKLGARTGGGEYARWLRESIGALEPKQRDLIEALASLGVVLATTNYDSLLERVTGLPPVTWMDGHRVERVLRGDERAVLHLHGYWERPESVILGIRSYEAILGSEHAQTMQRAMAALRCILFVGCGEGLSDPNFGALLDWTRTVFERSEYRCYRLTRSGDVAELRKRHPLEQRLVVLDYGADFHALPEYVRSLRPTPNALTAGQHLDVNEKLVSSNKRYILLMRPDGNLVLYREAAAASNAYWESGTELLPSTKRPVRLEMQRDTHLVLYDRTGIPRWASGTWGNGYVDPRVVLQDDGNLVIYHGENSALWATGNHLGVGAIAARGNVNLGGPDQKLG